MIAPAALVGPAAHAASAKHHPVAKDHHFVDSTITLNVSDPTSKKTGFDLDGDGNVNNRFAGIFAELGSEGLDVPGTIEAAVTSGAIVTLGSLHTTSLTNAKHANFRIYDGKPKASPVLTGGGKFTIDPAVPAGKAIKGSISKGTFTGEGGTIPLELSLVDSQPVIALKVVDAHVKAKCTATGCAHAKFGGAITRATVNAKIIPVIATVMTDIIQATCSEASPDTCSSEAQELHEIFDTNGDFIVTTQELLGNDLINGVFAPDVDLYKANGKPGHDGVADSLSIGFGFTASSAKFKQP
jgi:hypothetical protein